MPITDRHVARALALGAARARYRMATDYPSATSHEPIEPLPQEPLEVLWEDVDPLGLYFSIVGDKFPPNPTRDDQFELDQLTYAFEDGYDDEYYFSSHPNVNTKTNKTQETNHE